MAGGIELVRLPTGLGCWAVGECSPACGAVIGRVESILSPDFGPFRRTHSCRHWPEAGSHSRQRLCPGASPRFGSRSISRIVQAKNLPEGAIRSASGSDGNLLAANVHLVRTVEREADVCIANVVRGRLRWTECHGEVVLLHALSGGRESPLSWKPFSL